MEVARCGSLPYRRTCMEIKTWTNDLLEFRVRPTYSYALAAHTMFVIPVGRTAPMASSWLKKRTHVTQAMVNELQDGSSQPG